MNVKTLAAVSLVLSFTLLSGAAPLWAAEVPVTVAMQKKLDKVKKKALEWATDPLIVQAVREANAKGPIPGMGNAKWRELKDTDPLVQTFITSPAGQKLTRWHQTDPKVISRIVLTGNMGHRVAFTHMPALYLGKGRPNFDTSMDRGIVWQQPDIKADPVLKMNSLQISVPVRDGKEVIGVLLVIIASDHL